MWCTGGKGLLNVSGHRKSQSWCCTQAGGRACALYRMLLQCFAKCWTCCGHHKGWEPDCTENQVVAADSSLLSTADSQAMQGIVAAISEGELTETTAHSCLPTSLVNKVTAIRLLLLWERPALHGVCCTFCNDSDALQ